MGSPRRHTDSGEEDYTSERGEPISPFGGSPLNGQTKWAVALVTTAVVALAYWGLSNYTANVDKRLNESETDRKELHQVLQTTILQQSAINVESTAVRGEILRRLDKIDGNIEAIKRSR